MSPGLSRTKWSVLKSHIHKQKFIKFYLCICALIYQSIHNISIYVAIIKKKRLSIWEGIGGNMEREIVEVIGKRKGKWCNHTLIKILFLKSIYSFDLQTAALLFTTKIQNLQEGPERLIPNEFTISHRMKILEVKVTYLSASIKPWGILGGKKHEARVCPNNFLCFCYEQFTVIIQQPVECL